MRVIGVAGFARAGKDTFCSIAKEILAESGLRAKQYSFAYVLKKEVEPFLKDVCGCDVWATDTETKTDMRDFLVWYGTTWWRKRDPKRWIRYVDLAMKEDRGDVDVALISDVRYPNEGVWVHSWNGVLIHVSAYRWRTDRYKQGGNWMRTKEFFDAPNEQEKINDPIVKDMSDYRIEWEAKGLTLEEATKDQELRAEVRKSLHASVLATEMLSL